MEIAVLAASFTFTNVIIEMGIQPVNNTGCQILPADFVQLLASAVRVDAFGNAFLNFVVVDTTACECDPFMDCDKNHLPPDAVLRNLFTTDACGHLAIKMGNCDGTVVWGESEPQ